MGSPFYGRRDCLYIFCLIVVSFIASSVFAQGLQENPYTASNIVRNGSNPLDMGPSNPLAGPMGGLIGPRERDSILLSPGMFQGILPNIPNLQAGYLYSFGDNVESGRLSLDFLQPVMFGNSSAVFGEFHNEWQDFWKTVTRGANHRIDLSVGGGYRTLLNENTLVGVNAFYDTTRLGSKWYNSGGVGAEFTSLLPGNDSVDLTFNYYGNLFNSDVLANAFRRGPENYDFQAGYSHELWNGGPDLRLSATGYRFSSGSGVYGYRGGAELKSRDGMFSVKYEAAHDRVNDTYHTVGGFVNVGFQLSNLLNGESPFVSPEPIFKSPRKLGTRLTTPVPRSYVGPRSITLSRAPCCTGKLVVCGRVINHLDIFLNGEVPVNAIPDDGTYTISWCGANKDALRTDVGILIDQGDGVNLSNAPFNTGTGVPGLDDPVFMQASSGSQQVKDVTALGFMLNQVQYYELGANRPLDIRGGCLCIDWP